MYDITHAINVSRLSVKIGKRLGLDAESLMRLYASGLFHDIGKILVPEGLLEKPAALSRDEYGIIQWHTTLGHALLSQMPDDIHTSAAESALCHHERMDGKGYPQGLYGGQIPLFSRIIAVSDVYDALTTDRPYRRAWRSNDALTHIQDNAGSMFDAEIVNVLSQAILKKNGGTQ